MRIIRALTTAFLVLTTAWTQRSVVVLCIAPGGHVAIESGRNQCVAPAGLGEQNPGACGAALEHMDACCAPCADLPLGSSVFVRGSGSRDDVQQLKAPATLAASAHPLALEPRVAGPPCGAALRGAASLSRLAHPTIVLRC
jgi:hypothetical protein